MRAASISDACTLLQQHGDEDRLIAARALLDSVPRSTEAPIRQTVGGNPCRCPGYQQILELLQLAAERLSR